MQYPHGTYQQPVQTLPSSPFSQPHLLSSPSHAPASPSFAHAVPFGAIPGSQPGVLGWGVGMSASNGGGFGFSHAALARAASSRGQTPISVGWGSAAAAGSGSGQARPASPSPSAQGTPVNPRRRRRSASPGMSSDDDDAAATGRSAPSLRAVRPVQSLSAKRARRGPSASESGSAPGAAGSQGGGAPVVGDLGKALASLDKPALLNVFSRLLMTNPQLASTISAVLPTPSLPTLLDTLASLERAVVTATPSGAFLREEYIWSRVRVPLEEFVSEAKRFLAQFVPAQAPTGPISEDDLAHPSTAFQFLDALTHALLRLEVTLPPSPAGTAPANPLAAHLVPLTLNAWHLFLSRLSSAVNAQGKVLPTSLVRAWFAKLEDACTPPAAALFSPAAATSAGAGAKGESQVRRAMEGVRERARREIGWLVGLRPDVPPGVVAGGGGMEGIEQEEEL